MRRPPPGLGALLAVSTLLAFTWAAVTPAFQAPDEPAHFAYVQSIGERFKLPTDPNRPLFSDEENAAIGAINSDQVAAQLPVKPEWSDQVEDLWAAEESQRARDNGGGAGPNSNYPPSAYAWQAIGYLAGSGGAFFDELLGARLMSALWVPICVLGTWLLAGEALGRRRVLQTAAAAVPALLPMFTFISAAVGPDGMLFGVWTLALWLGARCIRRGVPLLEGAAFFALVGLACTIKVTSYALLPAAAVVALVGLAARLPLRVGPVARLSAAAVIPILLTLGTWFAISSAADRPAAAQLTHTAPSTGGVGGTNWRELASYLWQYYLPRTPVQQEYFVPPGGYPLVEVWMTQAWGAFGWLEVTFTPWVYIVLTVLTTGVFVAALASLLVARRGLDLRLAAFLALAFIGLLAGLHWSDYHQLENGALGFMQARYMFPVIGIFGLALAGAVRLLPAARRGVPTAIVVAALLAFHLASLGLVLERFYA